MDRFSSYRLFIGLLIAQSICACSLFLEEDIETDTLQILAPMDGISTEIVTQTFWWETLAGADAYRLQIVSPDFEATEALIVDTLVTSDKYEITLYPGDFEYRLRGENTAYNTAWTYARIHIISSDDLTRQTIRLRKPLNHFFTPETSIEFHWDTIPFVDSYELRIYQGAWEQSLVVDSINITQDHLQLDLNESELWWGVRAVNSQSETLFNTQRLVIDQTKPNQASLLLPQDNVTLSDTTVTFTWDSSDPEWETVRDSLFIYEARNLIDDQLVHKGLYHDKAHTIKLPNNKTYRWLVKSSDMAGNEGADSEVRSVTLSE